MNTTITEEWVSLWYQCLSMNIDYSAYCSARDQRNNQKCAALEARFENISSIYEDFGTLEQWPESGMQSELWHEWFKQRQHLFMPAPRVVTEFDKFVPRAGHVVLEVPLIPDSIAIANSIGELLQQEYASGRVQPPPKPKYSLRVINGRVAQGIQKVRQACRSVARSYLYDPESFEELRHVDAVAAFVRHEIENMGWTLDPRARAELESTGRLSEQRLESFKTRLNRCRRDFKAFSANTIRASFPDDRPFESDVQDIF